MRCCISAKKKRYECKKLKIKSISKYFLIVFVGLMLNGLMSGISYGQNSYGEESQEISINARVLDSNTLISGKTKISLWGIDKIDTQSAIFHLNIRQALEKKIGGRNILCVVKNKIDDGLVKAQCMNSKEEDLSLFLLRQGYASADRKEIYRSIYEAPYIDAEKRAQIDENGIWGGLGSSGEKQSKNFLMGSLLLVIVFILALVAISLHLMRGFSRVVDIQNQSIDLAAKERVLKDKEKYIIASMLDAEIRSNKAKIDAYITIYEETLLRLNDTGKALEYQKTGDIVQKQPSLSRSVFDGNTDKLDLLGSRLASNIIHYYARIKTSPDYIEIKTDTPQDEAREIIESVIDNAKKIGYISDKLTESFMQHALIKRLE